MRFSVGGGKEIAVAGAHADRAPTQGDGLRRRRMRGRQLMSADGEMAARVARVSDVMRVMPAVMAPADPPAMLSRSIVHGFDHALTMRRAEQLLEQPAFGEAFGHVKGQQRAEDKDDRRSRSNGDTSIWTET